MLFDVFTIIMSPDYSTIGAMLLQEKKHYFTRDYLGKSQATTKQHVSIENRRQQVEWVVRICDFFKYSKETADMCVSIFDRFMLTSSGSESLKSLKSFQLCAVTALYIASKVHEFEVMTSEVLSHISRNFYSVEDIERTESKMLEAIEWRVTAPTIFAFIKETVQIIPESVADKTVKRVVVDLANVQAECTLGDYDKVSMNKSVLAFAAVSNALECIGIPFDLISFLKKTMPSDSIIDFKMIAPTRKILHSPVLASDRAYVPVSKAERRPHGYRPYSPRSVKEST